MVQNDCRDKKNKQKPKNICYSNNQTIAKFHELHLSVKFKLYFLVVQVSHIKEGKGIRVKERCGER